MDPGLKLHLAAIADEIHLWQRLERHVWGEQPCCPDCQCPQLLRLMRRRTAAQHWRCSSCGIDFRATQATPLHTTLPIPLWVWCCTLMHLRQLGRRFSIQQYGISPPVSRAQHKAMQGIGELLLAQAHPLVVVLLAARLTPWRPPAPGPDGPAPARTGTLPTPAPRH